MEIIESVPPQRSKQQHIDYAYAAPYAAHGCAWVLGVPALIIELALIFTQGWASRTILAGVWPFLEGFFALVLAPCVGVIAWDIYKARKRQLFEENKRRNEQKLLSEQVKLTQQTNLLVQEARLQNDNVKIQFGDNNALKSIEVIRSAALAANQQARVKQIAENKPQQIGGVNGYSTPGLPAPAGRPEQSQQEQDTHEQEIVLPAAPPFKEISHLITPARMPLCFVNDRASGRVVPMFGTIDDLLSMAVTGKPGRGKTVALMYYVAMLLKNGAEVYVFDPHGAMAELAILNDRVLPGMPATARIHYFDRKETITGAIPGLYRELEDRDNYYRPQYVNGELVSRRVKHPLLVLADELPILADFDEQVAIEYKRINRQRLKDGDEELEVPSLIYLIRRIVLEARKWRCFFIGSGQSMDAEVLPTKVTENLNSRIVFFSSNRRARMSGLENDAIKNLLPLIRRGGSGVMVYDCARWDEPLIGAIPYITVDDLLDFLGVDLSDSGADLGIFGAGSTSGVSVYEAIPTIPTETTSKSGLNKVSKRDTGELENPVKPLIEQSGSIPDVSPLGPDDMRFTEDQIVEFIKLFRALGNRKECLRRMRNPRSASGYGLSNRYDKHAKLIVEQYKLEQK